ncbi:MAG TPA: tRNA pseudouridine(55) synthase TruB [Anaerolineales bacterium]|nr:tRNA pseudouridine(55) synthase TruB [Anaerolineales bacterium]
MKAFGLIIVDKPVGPTSHQIVGLVRKGTGIRKVGHAGTLDPRASGVLVLCLGAATRLSEYLSITAKEYEALVRFGASTRTFDTDGEITRRTDKAPTRRQIEAVLPQFQGDIVQKPPPYSAIKIQGRKAYEMARAGDEPPLEPRQIHISRLEIRSYTPPDLALMVECSAGTYIRSLAHDLGEAVGTGAHLAALKRTKAGPFRIQEAVPLPMLEVGFLTGKWVQYVRPASDALPELDSVQVDEASVAQLRDGHRIPAAGRASGLAKAIGPDGELVAILESADEGALWHPRKVFVG